MVAEVKNQLRPMTHQSGLTSYPDSVTGSSRSLLVSMIRKGISDDRDNCLLSQ